MNKDSVVFGSGELYVKEYTGNQIPNKEEIEKPENNVGHCQGGFTAEYMPDVYDVKNQYGKIVKRFVKGETITAKTGILTWNLKNLELLSTAKFSEDKGKKTRKITFGGSGNALKTVVILFVHIKEDGKKLTFMMIGQAGNGFSIEFADKETVIDAEFSAIDKVDNFLAEIEEEMEGDE